MHNEEYNEVNARIGARIKILRKMRNINSMELADKLGIHRTQMSRIENGASGILVSRLFEIANILDTPIEDFFEKFE